MTEQELGRCFEHFVKTVLENNSVQFEYEKKVKPKTHVFPNQIRGLIKTSLRHRKKFYEPDFIIDNSIWIECTTKISNAPKKELLYAHQCSKLIILYLYSENTLIEPYFANTSYVFIDDYLRDMNILSKYHNELEKLRSITNEK